MTILKNYPKKFYEIEYIPNFEPNCHYHERFYWYKVKYNINNWIQNIINCYNNI